MDESRNLRIGTELSGFIRRHGAAAAARGAGAAGFEAFFLPADVLAREGRPPLLAAMIAIWLMRPDLQSAFDIEIPAGRDAFLYWCFAHGRREYGLLREALARPDICSIYGVPAPDEQTDGSRQPESLAGGVNVIGHVHAALGLGEDARCAVAALAAARVPFCVIDSPPGPDIALSTTVFAEDMQSAPLYQTNLLFMTGLETLRLFCEKGSVWWRGRRNIGIWPWELPRWPEPLEFCLALVDEIWAISDFVRDAFEIASPGPVIHMPPAVLPISAQADRAAFGLQPGQFVFLAMFDGKSSFDRKNPEAAIRAFRQAFPPHQRHVRLVVKAMRARAAPQRWLELHASAAGDARIEFIDGEWSRQQTLSLLASCDCLVSLHRSEGFGRPLAEAVMLRKPVISTHWSGNVDFRNEGEQLLVEGPLRKVEPGQYPWGAGQVWMDPDVSAAAQAFRAAAEIRSLPPASSAFDPAKVGARYRLRLEKLGLISQPE